VVRHGCGNCVVDIRRDVQASRWLYFGIVGLSDCAGSRHGHRLANDLDHPSTFDKNTNHTRRRSLMCTLKYVCTMLANIQV
jgi:hypothetical protein